MILWAQENASKLPSCLVHVREGEFLALHRAEGGALWTPSLQKETNKKARDEDTTPGTARKKSTPKNMVRVSSTRFIREETKTVFCSRKGDAAREYMDVGGTGFTGFTCIK